MKYFLRAARTNSRLKMALTCAGSLTLAVVFWTAVPNILAANQGRTPAELLQAKLPGGATIASASDSQLLDAVCGAVKDSPSQAGLIARTAGGPRRDLRGKIICQAARCGGSGGLSDPKGDAKGADCSWLVDIVHEWSKSDPDMANRLVESVGQCSPECRDLLLSPGEGPGNFGNPPVNINAPPGSSGGGSGGNVCQVCHNGSNVQVACTDLDSYLASHPGDTSGACPATPSQNP